MKILLKRKNSSLFSILSFIFFLNCSSLKNGDLLFVSAKDTGLSGAISAVTKQSSLSFDHVGIVEKNKNVTYVLDASPNGGSKKQSLEAFLAQHKESKQKLVLYRLKKKYQKAIPQAIENANKMLGKPYNELYILDENSYYCSDFVERAFRHDRIFSLAPMHFIDPKTKAFLPFWVSFYKSKNREIPEGALGSNPNGLSVSEKIRKIRVVEIK